MNNRVQELFNNAVERFNRWQRRYEESGDAHALKIMYQYAGQMDVLSKLMEDEDEEH